MRVEARGTEGATRRAGEAVLAGLDELVEEWLDRMWEEPDYADWARPELREPARENARRDIGREVETLAHDRVIPTACPREVAASARLAASTGFPLEGVLQSYRTGHAVQWEAWRRAV